MRRESQSKAESRPKIVAKENQKTDRDKTKAEFRATILAPTFIGDLSEVIGCENRLVLNVHIHPPYFANLNSPPFGGSIEH